VQDLIAELRPGGCEHLVEIGVDPPASGVGLLLQAFPDLVEHLDVVGARDYPIELVREIVVLPGVEHVAALPRHAGVVRLLEGVVDANHEGFHKDVELCSGTFATEGACLLVEDLAGDDVPEIVVADAAQADELVASVPSACPGREHLICEAHTIEYPGRREVLGASTPQLWL
jgi:hypothetical protein